MIRQPYDCFNESVGPTLTFAPIIVRFFGLRFPPRFVYIVGDRGLRRMRLQFIRASVISCLARMSFVDVLNLSEPYGELRETSYGNRRVHTQSMSWKSYGACAMSVRNPYDF